MTTNRLLPYSKHPDFYREFAMQRAMSVRRSIPWQLTFDEWITWWGDDVILRGRHRDSLVMARLDINGPYCLDNIEKIMHWENVSRNTKDRPTAKTKSCFTPIGNFISVSAAARAYGHANSMTILRRVKSDSHPDYGFT